MSLTRLRYLFYLIPAGFYLVLNDNPMQELYNMEQGNYPILQLLASISLFVVLLLIRKNLVVPTQHSAVPYSSKPQSMPIVPKQQPSTALYKLIAVAVILLIILLFLTI